MAFRDLHCHCLINVLDRLVNTSRRNAEPGILFVTEVPENLFPLSNPKHRPCMNKQDSFSLSYIHLLALASISSSCAAASEIVLPHSIDSPTLAVVRSQRHFLYIPGFTVRRRRFYPRLSYPSNPNIPFRDRARLYLVTVYSRDSCCHQTT